MGLFSISFTQDIAIDLGTANTIIFHNGKMVVNEPSVIALSVDDRNVVRAVGRRAQQMVDRGNKIRTVRPLKDGVIADFRSCELMIQEMIRLAFPEKRLFAPNLRMVVCVPSGSTDVEIRAVRDSCEHAGGKTNFLIYEPMAAALGMGIDVERPEGCMIVDIGGGTTEIAVIALGGIVCNKSIKTAGDEFNEDIMNYMSNNRQMRISEPTAEKIKINVGSALMELEDDIPDDYAVIGPSRIDALPLKIPISYTEIANCLNKSIEKIETAITMALEETPSELYADIVKNGIQLTGGGALLRGLDKRIENKFHIPCYKADDPLLSVAHGTSIALKNIDNFSFFIQDSIR